MIEGEDEGEEEAAEVDVEVEEADSVGDWGEAKAQEDGAAPGAPL